MNISAESLEIAQDAVKSKHISGRTVMKNFDNQPLGLIISSDVELTIHKCSESIRRLIEKYELLVCENCNYNPSLKPGRVADFDITDFSLQDPWHEDVFFHETGEMHTITSLSKTASEFRLQDTYYGVKDELKKALSGFYQNDQNFIEYIASMRNNKNHFNFTGYDNSIREKIQYKYPNFMENTYKLLSNNKRYRISWKLGKPKSIFHINKHNGSLVHGRPYLNTGDDTLDYGNLSSKEHLFLKTVLPRR